MTDQLIAPVLTVIVTCYLIALILRTATRRSISRRPVEPPTGRGPSGDPKPSPPESPGDLVEQFRRNVDHEVRLRLRMGIVTKRLARAEAYGQDPDDKENPLNYELLDTVADELTRLAVETQMRETATHGGAW